MTNLRPWQKGDPFPEIHDEGFQWVVVDVNGHARVAFLVIDAELPEIHVMMKGPFHAMGFLRSLMRGWIARNRPGWRMVWTFVDCEGMLGICQRLGFRVLGRTPEGRTYMFAKLEEQN